MYNVHDSVKDMSVEQLQILSSKDRLNFSVCLLNLEYDLNIGNCIRSAHLLGAQSVFIFGKRKYDSRSTVGAHNYTKVIRIEVEDIEDRDLIASKFTSMVVDYSLYPLMIEKNRHSLPISKIRRTADYIPGELPCLVIGNEQSGIPDYIVEGHQSYHIEQRGVIRSFNAASAAAIAMYEFTRKE